MPYRKKTTQRRRPIKYSKTKQMITGHGPTLLEKIASGAGSVAKLATAVAPMIAAINTEHKYHDLTAAVQSHSPGTSDQIINLTQGIIQGLTDSNRIGNSILAKDLQIRLAHNFQNTVGTPNVMGIHCRMMLICWKENIQLNGPTAARIFESPSNLYSPVNKDYSDQFVVLKDKFFNLNSPISISAPVGFTSNKLFKPLNWHIRYQDATAFSGTLNHVFLILRSSASGATNSLNTTYYSRLNYTDN